MILFLEKSIALMVSVFMTIIISNILKMRKYKSRTYILSTGIIMLFCLMINLGCQEPPRSEDMKSANTPPDKNLDYTIIKTLFATDRKSDINNNFNHERDTLKYGVCNISIPNNHTRGEIERPKWWKLELKEDAKKHVVIQNKKLVNKVDFFTKESAEFEDRLFLFVHGYNVSFDDAARRTAQIAYDISFNGIPMFYSWPSNSKTLAYSYDSDNIKFSIPKMKRFVQDLIDNYPNHEINLIAHSMGNRGLTRALVDLFKEHPEDAKRINQIILAAPDIDAQIFEEQIAPTLTANANSITLYTSTNDKALKASEKFNGHVRIGDSGKGVAVIEGIETVDATDLDTGFLGHSYFGESNSVISDIDQLIDNGLKAKERKGLKSFENNGKTFWKFQ